MESTAPIGESPNDEALVQGLDDVDDISQWQVAMMNPSIQKMGGANIHTDIIIGQGENLPKASIIISPSVISKGSTAALDIDPGVSASYGSGIATMLQQPLSASGTHQVLVRQQLLQSASAWGRTSSLAQRREWGDICCIF